MPEERWDVFISYKSQDRAIAEELQRRLEAAGLRVWFDRARLEPGCRWHEEIEAGCEGSRVILPVLTPRWPASEWCRYETYGGECIVPLLFEGDLAELLREVPPVAEWQGVVHDLREADEAQWQRLVTAIRQRLQEPPPDKARRTAHLPFAANRCFVGREAELIEMHEKLCRAPTVALSHGPAFVLEGLGGIGKTTLARQYAEKFWRLYQDILWVSAANTELLSSEFARLALELGVIERLSDDPEADARRAVAELEAGPRRLLIIDNAQDEQAVQDWLPRHGKCHTVITSRFTAWSAEVQTVYIHVLEPEPARELLLGRSGLPDCPENCEAADRLAEEVQYLPLALEQAAAYVRSNAITFEQYLDLYHAARAELLARGVAGGTRYPESVATTWLTTVRRLSPRALAILRLVAFMAPDPLPRRALEDCRDLLGEAAVAAGDPRGSGRTELSALELTEALGELRTYSMVQLDSDALRVHRLVQAVQQDGLPDAEQADWVQRGLALLVREFPAAEHSDWQTCEALLPHALACSGHALEMDLVSREAGRLLLLGGHFLVNRGQMSSARAPLEQALDVFEQLAAQDAGNLEWQRYLSLSQNMMGDVLAQQGRLTVALEAYQAAFEITEHLATIDQANAQWQRDLSVSHEKLGYVLQAQGDQAGALAAYQAALAIAERLAAARPGDPGQQHDLSVSHEQIGAVLLALGDLSGALEHYEANLAIAERLAAADPGNAGWQRGLSVSHNNLGDVLWAQGDQAGALKAYQASLAIAERLAVGDPGNAGWQRNVAVSHDRLGDVLVAQGDLSGAWRTYQAALSIAERLALADPGNVEWQHDLSVSHMKLGDVLVAQGDLSEALGTYQAALAIAERVAAAAPSNAGWQRDLSVSHERLGDVLRAQGNLSGALEAYRPALAIRERLAGVDPGNAGWQRDLAASLQRVARVAHEAGQPDEVREHLLRCREVLRQMRARGMYLDPPIAQLLERLETGIDTVAYATDYIMTAPGQPGDLHLTVSSAPHPGADPNEATRLNRAYQHELRRWRALPFWRRFLTPKPTPPTGI